MFNEEIFNFNIDNIKNDLAIEGMEITDTDVNLTFINYFEFCGLQFIVYVYIEDQQNYWPANIQKC